MKQSNLEVFVDELDNLDKVINEECRTILGLLAAGDDPGIRILNMDAAAAVMSRVMEDTTRKTLAVEHTRIELVIRDVLRRIVEMDRGSKTHSGLLMAVATIGVIGSSVFIYNNQCGITLHNEFVKHLSDLIKKSMEERN